MVFSTMTNHCSFLFHELKLLSRKELSSNADFTFITKSKKQDDAVESFRNHESYNNTVESRFSEVFGQHVKLY